jgi:homoserine O-acetyltransferase
LPSTDFEVYRLGNVVLQSGATLHDARLAYKTYGRLTGARDNVVVMPTYYGAHHSDLEVMMGAGRALDPSRYFIIVPNMFGNGLSSSPSNSRAPQGRAAFPHVTIYDNVVCQHRLVREHLGIPHVRLVAGFSMGAQQAFQWGALFPDMIDAIVPVCGTARTSPHNYVFLDGIKAALCADAAFKDGWYNTPPEKGLRAFGRVYAGWVYSQDFYRDREHVKLGLETVEDVMAASESRYLRRDANDLLAMLWTWQHADISRNATFNGDLPTALGAIQARAIVMPASTDLYFRVRDNECEVLHMRRAELRPIPTIWGHAAGRGLNPPDNAFIDQALRDALK